MTFLLTSYIFPLKEKVLFSEHFDFYLDNPRTKEEINAVKSFLKKNYKAEDSIKVPIKFKTKEENDAFVTVEKLIGKLRETFYLKEDAFTEFFDKYEKKSVFEFVARMWIIAKFDDKDLVKEHKSDFEETPVEKKLTTLFDYNYLVALLIQTQERDYFGQGFIYNKYSPPPLLGPWHNFLTFGSVCYNFDGWRDTDWRWWVFPYLLEKLESIRPLLDKALTSGLEEKLLYVGNTLKIADDTREEKTKLLLLTSIIEMLLTHSPNTNRFNVEDSINKQFQLKASILVYLNDKSRDIEAIQKRLKIIYEQRSNVAHGNFNALNKFIKNLSKKEDEEEFFSDFISDLYSYIRAILEEYLKDKNFVEFLKDS